MYRGLTVTLTGQRLTSPKIHPQMEATQDRGPWTKNPTESVTVHVDESVHLLQTDDETVRENLGEDHVNEHGVETQGQPDARRHAQHHGSRVCRMIGKKLKLIEKCCYLYTRVCSFRLSSAVFQRSDFHTSIAVLREKQSRRTRIGIQISKTSTPQAKIQETKYWICSSLLIHSRCLKILWLN